jgi:hypothetical protein
MPAMHFSETDGVDRALEAFQTTMRKPAILRVAQLVTLRRVQWTYCSRF